MVRIIMSARGKGRAKRLLGMANEAVKNAKGTAAYLDKSAKHMYELNNKVRLINVNDYKIMSSDGFAGFAPGIISQDRDLEAMFLDSLLKLTNLESGNITPVVDTLGKIGEKYDMNFVLGILMDAADLPENMKKGVVIAL